MDSREKKLVLICDNDADHSFTLEGELRNQDYDVIIISDGKELVESAKSLRPVTVLVNPDIKGLNEHDLCKQVMNELKIPVILLVDKHSTHRDTIGECRAGDVVTKPVQSAGNVAMLIAKHNAVHNANS